MQYTKIDTTARQLSGEAMKKIIGGQLFSIFGDAWLCPDIEVSGCYEHLHDCETVCPEACTFVNRCIRYL